MQVVDPDHQTCRACRGGEQPNANRTECLPCGQIMDPRAPTEIDQSAPDGYELLLIEGPTYSPIGGYCTWCPPPMQVNAERTMW